VVWGLQTSVCCFHCAVEMLVGHCFCWISYWFLIMSSLTPYLLDNYIFLYRGQVNSPRDGGYDRAPEFRSLPTVAFASSFLWTGLTIPQHSSPSKVIMWLSLPAYVWTAWLDYWRVGSGGVDSCVLSTGSGQALFLPFCSVRADWSQAMLVIIRTESCLPVCYPKIWRLIYTEL